MTPDDVLSGLKLLEIDITRQTLNRYTRDGIIPEPKRGAYGRGGGRYTDYPDGTTEEAYASWSLMHGQYGDEHLKAFFGGKLPCLSPKVVKMIRDKGRTIAYESKFKEEDRIFSEFRPLALQDASRDTCELFDKFVDIWVAEARKAYKLLRKK